MKKVLPLILSLLTSAIMANAQVTLPNQVKVSLPRELNTKALDKKTAYAVQKNPPARFEKETGYWNAYSDRADNPTYQSPSKSAERYATLDFNQEVIIADIKDGWALVYTDVPGTKFPRISKSDATSLGWIPVENLLLWKFCPMDERGIYEKALLTANIDQLSESNARNQLRELNLAFSAPKGGRSTPISMQKIYFVMKELGDRVLLSSEYTLDGDYSSKVLVGWVSKAAFTPWNQRSCLEPSSNKHDIRDELDGEKAKTYADSELQHLQSSWTFDKEHTERMDKSSMRFPILNNDVNNDKLYKCTVFGASGEIRPTPGSGSKKSEAAIEEFMNTTKKINLIIVIDGTTSMKPYYAEVKNAISRGLNYFNNNYDMRVGCVIYRDITDGDAAVEYLPLMDSKDPRLAEFLDNGGKHGVGSSPNDKTMEEDMFLGLETALDAKKMGYDPKQSNLILLVGDCGNVPDDKRQADIVEKMDKNRIQFMSFQCNYDPRSGAYQLFRSQTQSMMKNNLDRQFGRLDKDGKFRAKYPELSDGTGRKYKAMDKDLFVGIMRYPKGQGKLANSVLEEMMTHDLKDFSDVIQNQFDILVTTLNAAVAPENKVEYAWLIERLGKEAAEQLFKNNSLMAYTGYTPKASESGKPYWAPVIFISHDELLSMLGRMKPAYEVALKGGDNRKPYVEVLEAIVKAMDPTAQTGNTDLGQITALLAGINVQTASTGSKARTLNDLMEPKVVTPQEYRGILNDFKTHYDRLVEISNKYDYTREFQGIKYYWIPVSDLP